MHVEFEIFFESSVSFFIVLAPCLTVGDCLPGPVHESHPRPGRDRDVTAAEDGMEAGVRTGEG